MHLPLYELDVRPEFGLDEPFSASRFDQGAPGLVDVMDHRLATVSAREARINSAAGNR